MESERREIANTETPVPLFLHTVKGTAQVSNPSESTTCRIRAYVHTYSVHIQDSKRTRAGYVARAHNTILRGRACSLGHIRGACVQKTSEVFCFKQRVRNVFDHHTKY